MSIICAYWSFSTALFHIIQHKAIAVNIHLVSILGPVFLPALITHAIITLCREDLAAKGKHLLFILYIPFVVIAVGFFVPGMIIDNLSAASLGWLVKFNIYSPFVWLFFIFYFITYIFNLFLLIRWERSLTSGYKKKQARIIILSFFISMTFIFAEEISCKIFRIQPIPSLSHFGILIWFFGVFFLIQKYQFIAISPEKAIQEILFNMMDIFILTGKKGEISRVNQQFTQLLGYTDQDIETLSVSQLFDNGLDLSSINTFTQCRKNVLSKKNKLFPMLLRISPLKNGDQEILGHMIIGHDARERERLEQEIIERHEAEKKVIESRSQYISTINAMEEMIHVVDPDLYIILCNNTCLNVVRGFLKDFIIGNTRLPDLFSFLDQEVYNEYRRVFETGKPVITEDQNIIGRETFYTETRKIPVFRNEKVEFVVTIMRDVTEKKKLEQSQLRAEIADSVSLLAGGIAHDYNNLLTTILGNIVLAKTYYSNKALYNESLSEAESAGLQARDLTQQLLTFSRKGTLEKEAGDLSRLLKKSVSFFLSGSNVKCELMLPDDLYHTLFNKQQIARVFQNLLLNAKQAMPDGGVLSILAHNRIVEKSKDSMLSPGKYIEISFIDQGIGIPEDIIPKIFNPYFTTKKSGSGLGLATAYSIMKNHGGILEVASKVGRGTTVRMYLPVSELDEYGDKHRVTRGLRKGKGTILVMDDEKHVRDTFKRLLEHLGYSVVATEDGEKAVAIYTRALKAGRKFDLVLLDYTIQGGVNGGEVFRELCQCDPGVKALIVSGYGSQMDVSGLMDMGLKGIVKKPFDIADLSELLEKILCPEEN
jgi:PAS domain S-box-containing protein